MTQISLDEVKKLARLSKLAITDTEAKKFQTEIASILAYVDQLNEVDTTTVEPTSQVTGLVNASRQDEVIEYGVDQAGLLDNVPAVTDKYIKVKKVL